MLNILRYDSMWVHTSGNTKKEWRICKEWISLQILEWYASDVQYHILRRAKETIQNKQKYTIKKTINVNMYINIQIKIIGRSACFDFPIGFTFIKEKYYVSLAFFLIE